MPDSLRAVVAHEIHALTLPHVRVLEEAAVAAVLPLIHAGLRRVATDLTNPAITPADAFRSGVVFPNGGAA